MQNKKILKNLIKRASKIESTSEGKASLRAAYLKKHPMGTPVHKIQGPSKRANMEHVECGCEWCRTERNRGIPADMSTVDPSIHDLASTLNELLAYERKTKSSSK